MSKPILHLVDELINPEIRRPYGSGDYIFSKRLGNSRLWTEVPPLEEKVERWSAEHPVIWNIGIGPRASFVPTLTRLLFDRTKDLYGPYDHIIHMRLTPLVGAGRIAAQHLLAVEVLMKIATTFQVPWSDDKLHELTQRVADESYYRYGTISDNLMLEIFGQEYVDRFGSDPSVKLDPNYDREPHRSPMHEMIRTALREKKCLMLAENLHVPVLLDVLAFTMGKQPSLSQNRWLISTTSKDIWDKSRHVYSADRYSSFYHYAPQFSNLLEREWAVLIKEALHDVASSIHNAHQQQDIRFWLHVVQHCLYYSILYHPLKGAGHKASSTTVRSSVNCDELVRCWVTENLIFSTRSPTGKKQSNYRSAYEAGKLIIQALQEYSLLSINSISNTRSSIPRMASTSASTPQNTITGMSKLAMGVPRLKKDELFYHDKSNELTWVSFLNGDGRHVSWDWRPNSMKPNCVQGEMTLTTLILRGCSNITGFPFDKVFTPHLHVLDLSYTPINSLHPGFSRLLNLKLLSLRGCSQLETLSPPPHTSGEETPPLAYLGNLQVLDLNGVPLLELTQEDVSNRSSLHYLDLSGSRITTLPSQFFSEMSSLEELILVSCSHLKELPPSLAELYNLLVLHVEGTQITFFPEDTFESMQRLHTLKLFDNILLMSLPKSLSKAKGLKELHIYNCISLSLQFLWEQISFVEVLYIQAWDDFTALEEVDITGTIIEDVPHHLPNLPQLRKLLLLNVPCFKRFPWHQLDRFPSVFYLDHCAVDVNQFSKIFCQQEIREDKTYNTAQININDPRMFYSFDLDAANKLVEKGQFLQCFNIRVKPCSLRGKEQHENEVVLFSNKQRVSPYHDVHYLEVASVVPLMELQPRQRHVEISANDRYPSGLSHLLSVINSIFITEDDFIRCLTDLNYSLMSLEECQLQHCHQMTVLLRMRSQGSEALSSLKIMQASNLKNLLSFVEPSLSYSELLTLKLLKHIHLEYCPRLEKIFPCSLALPKLETLVILFCSNLKTIFYKQSGYKVTPSPLPNIRRIYIQELPQLHHIHEDVMFRFEMPKWEKLFIRGCRSFQCLPLLKKEYQKSKVKVSGERDWCDNLQLILPEQEDYYLQVPAPEFASPKRNVIIKSYLR